jgi:hypothetical protein
LAHPGYELKTHKAAKNGRVTRADAMRNGKWTRCDLLKASAASLQVQAQSEEIKARYAKIFGL